MHAVLRRQVRNRRQIAQRLERHLRFERRVARPSFTLAHRRSSSLRLGAGDATPPAFIGISGRLRSESPAEIVGIRSWGAFIAVLLANDMLDRDAGPRDRLKPEFIELFISSPKSHLSDRTLHMFICDLSVMATALVPGYDAGWIRRHPLRPTNAEAIASMRPRPPIDLAAAIKAAVRDMKEVDLLALDTRSAIRFRDDLLFATASAIPLRHKNLVEMEIGKHLREIGDGYMVTFEPHETKTSRWFRADLPERLAPFMRRWLSHYRAFLLRDRRSAAVWLPMARGGGSVTSLYARFQKTGLRLLGRRVHPHLTRHAAATTILNRDPRNARFAADVLHHVSTRGALNTYDHSNSYAAQRMHRALLERDLERREDEE